MKDYDKNTEFSYIQYWDVNNLYGWAMSQKLSVHNFEWIKDSSQFNEDFVKNYNEQSDEGYFLDVDVHYFDKLYELHNSLTLLPEKMKILIIKKLVPNLHDSTINLQFTEYVIHTKKLKLTLNHRVVFKKVHTVIKLNQKSWLKPYNDMNSDLRFLKRFFKLTNNAVFEKNYEKCEKMKIY